MGPPSLTMTTSIEPGNRQCPLYTTRRQRIVAPPIGGDHVEREEIRPRRAGRQRPRRRPARARPNHAHDVVVGVTDAPHHRRRAAGLGDRGGKGDERPRQVPDAAEAPLGAAGDLRRRPGRPRRPFVRHRELHAGAAHPADDRGAPRRGRDLARQLGRLLADLLEALPKSRRVDRAAPRAVLGRRRPEGLRRAQEVRRQDRQRQRRPRGRGEEADRTDHRRLDPEGQRQGRGRRQDPRRVPRRAEESRRGPVSAPERGWERRTDAILGVAASAILLAMMLLTFVDVVARYVFNRPVRGAFEVTELMLVVLIFAGLPLVSWADEQALMDFVDRLLGARAQRGLERAVQLVCAAVMFLLTWLMWLKADRIWAYRDATDVLRIVYGPFVYFMAVMIGLSGLIHLYKVAERR